MDPNVRRKIIKLLEGSITSPWLQVDKEFLKSAHTILTVSVNLKKLEVVRHQTGQWFAAIHTIHREPVSKIYKECI